MWTLEVVRLAAHVYARYLRIETPTLSHLAYYIYIIVLELELEVLIETIAPLQNRSQFHQEKNWREVLVKHIIRGVAVMD